MNILTDTWQPFAVGLGVSFFLSVILVLTKHLHCHLTADPSEGIQKVHTSVTPRVGGIAIFLGATLGWHVAPPNFFGDLFWTLLVASIPAFFVGLLEDITKRVSALTRLLATVSCSMLGYALTNFSISDVNVNGLDWLMQFMLVSLIFTAFSVAGVTNSLNIIDGLNGLSAGTALIISGVFYVICIKVGDIQLSNVCVLIFSAVLGFFLLNWPWGRIFLGDGGAYFVGFVIAWIGVILTERHPEISAWAPLLACGYPVLEVIFSMLRRHRRGLKIGAPDRLHLHSLCLRRVTKRLFPTASKLAQNSITGGAMLLSNIPPILISINWYTNTPMLMVGFAFTVLVYSAIYARLTQFVWCFSAVTTRDIHMHSVKVLP
jgi:UDP-N-acetylmuramyl pentapeptide phosphotransferase/UDP-N-acetylglucosamine-1-phosphate transferase